MSFTAPGTFIVDDDDEDWLLPPPKPDAYPPGTKPLSIEELLKDVRLSENAGTLSRKIAKHQRRERERVAFWDLVKCASECDSPLSVPPPPPTTPMSDEDDFQDASDSFSEDVLKSITKRRCLTNICDDSATGQSLVRPIMSQSLVKVEEEEPIVEFKQALQNSKRSSRSASVSPRPIPNPAGANRSNTRSDILNDENEKFSLTPRNVLVRRSLGAQPMKKIVTTSPASNPRPDTKRLLLTSTSKTTRDQFARTKTNPVDNTASQNGMSAVVGRQRSTVQPSVPILAVSSQRPSLLVTNLHPTIQSVQDIARQQEEALREEVLKQQLQQQQIERKHSWQENGSEPPSVNTSMGSLTSSKSVDIGAIVKTPRLTGGHSRLPRPTGIPLPTKVTHPAIRNPIASLAKPQSYNDEDEFF